MVRRTARVANYSLDESDGGEESDPSDVSSDDDYGNKKRPLKKRTPKKKQMKSPRKKISPSKTPASKRGRRAGSESNEEYGFTDEADFQDGDSDVSDYQQKGRKKISKKLPAKKYFAQKSAAPSPANRGGSKGKGKGGVKGGGKRAPAKKKSIYYDPSGSEEEDEPEESEEESEEEEEYYSKKKSPAKKRPAPAQKDNFPPVSIMVLESIRALKDNPRKGSTLSAIKETIGLNWPVNMKQYDSKIKKFITKALESGELLQPKGKGFRGRFTIPGMKIKKKKKKKKFTEKEDEADDVVYKPSKTARDEGREKSAEEIAKRREELRVEAELKEQKRAERPKQVRPKRDEWVVEAISAVKEKDGKTFYKVKFEGYPKPQWEPEENVQGCDELLEDFEDKEEKRREEEERRKAEELEGNFEVARITEVKFNKDKTRSFLIRWKGHGPMDDSWEPEANLDCADKIEKFMAKWEHTVMASEKTLRVAPKKVSRLNFGASHRLNKRNHGCRVTYEDMDE